MRWVAGTRRSGALRHRGTITRRSAHAGRPGPAPGGREWFTPPPVTSIIADVSAERVLVSLGDLHLYLWRVVGLESFVNREAQLCSDAPPEPPYWMHLWPGAVALARQVAEAPEMTRGVRVIELGAGLGLPALAAAARGARVVAADRSREALRFLRASAALNGLRVDTVQMDWNARALRGSFDVCLAAEATYDAAAEAPLIAGLHTWLPPGGIGWLADSVNTQRGSVRAALVEEGFAVRTSDRAEWEEGRRVWVRLIEARRRP